MLGIWMYQWDTADWEPAPPPPVVDEADEARGSGHKHAYSEPDYYRAGDDFWEVREAYLRSKFPPETKQIIEEARKPEPEPVVQKLAELDKAYYAARSAQNIIDLENQVLNILELTRQILSLRAQYDDEAITLLLLF